MSLEPDEKELEKIRKNMARAYKELMELAPIIEGKKYRKELKDVEIQVVEIDEVKE